LFERKQDRTVNKSSSAKDGGKTHSKRMPRAAALLYFGWSSLQFFGSLGSAGHAWWPVLLYPLIWPVSLVIEQGSLALFTLLFGDTPPDSYWLVLDHVSGFLYIVGGTIWIWFLATVLPKLGSKSFRGRP
jgi:hypothetical protein